MNQGWIAETGYITGPAPRGLIRRNLFAGILARPVPDPVVNAYGDSSGG